MKHTAIAIDYIISGPLTSITMFFAMYFMSLGIQMTPNMYVIGGLSLLPTINQTVRLVSRLRHGKRNENKLEFDNNIFILNTKTNARANSGNDNDVERLVDSLKFGDDLPAGVSVSYHIYARGNEKSLHIDIGHFNKHVSNESLVDAVNIARRRLLASGEQWAKPATQSQMNDYHLNSIAEHGDDELKGLVEKARATLEEKSSTKH